MQSECSSSIEHISESSFCSRNKNKETNRRRRLEYYILGYIPVEQLKW